MRSQPLFLDLVTSATPPPPARPPPGLCLSIRYNILLLPLSTPLKLLSPFFCVGHHSLIFFLQALLCCLWLTPCFATAQPSNPGVYTNSCHSTSLRMYIPFGIYPFFLLTISGDRALLRAAQSPTKVDIHIEFCLQLAAVSVSLRDLVVIFQRTFERSRLRHRRRWCRSTSLKFFKSSIGLLRLYFSELGINCTHRSFACRNTAALSVQSCCNCSSIFHFSCQSPCPCHLSIFRSISDHPCPCPSSPWICP